MQIYALNPEATIMSLNHHYTATVLATRAPVSIGESGPMSCRCDLLIITYPNFCRNFEKNHRTYHGDLYQKHRLVPFSAD